MNAPTPKETLEEASNVTAASMRLINASTYDEWKAAAMAQDERMGGAKWRSTDKSTLYDHEVIRRRLEEVTSISASGDARVPMRMIRSEGSSAATMLSPLCYALAIALEQGYI